MAPVGATDRPGRDIEVWSDGNNVGRDQRMEALGLGRSSQEVTAEKLGQQVTGVDSCHTLMQGWQRSTNPWERASTRRHCQTPWQESHRVTGYSHSHNKEAGNTTAMD